MIFCDEAPGGSASPADRSLSVCPKIAGSPLRLVLGDVDLITGTETSPHVVQSETYTRLIQITPTDCRRLQRFARRRL